MCKDKTIHPISSNSHRSATQGVVFYFQDVKKITLLTSPLWELSSLGHNLQGKGVFAKKCFVFLVLSHCFLDFSVGVGAFVIGLSQISSLFLLTIKSKCKTLAFVMTEYGHFAKHLLRKGGDWPNKNRNFAVQNYEKNVVYFLNCEM